MPTAEQVVATVEAYAAAVGTADKDKIMALYTEDAVVQDPYPNPPHEGKEAVGGFWDGVLAMGTPVEFVPEKIVVTADRGVFAFAIRIDLGEGEGKVRLQVEGYDILTISDDGRISNQLAYWDPARMHPVPSDG